MFSEVFILLGAASVLRWAFDLTAFAGIIIAIGSGVDDQIVILDEITKTQKDKFSNLKDLIKKAFFIVFGTYATTCAAMIPLFFAGVGILKGFAFTTIIGLSIGVFITRKAFSSIIRIIYKYSKEDFKA
jgi:preprotein translocase subunit SecD